MFGDVLQLFAGVATGVEPGVLVVVDLDEVRRIGTDHRVGVEWCATVRIRERLTVLGAHALAIEDFHLVCIATEMVVAADVLVLILPRVEICDRVRILRSITETGLDRDRIHAADAGNCGCLSWSGGLWELCDTPPHDGVHVDQSVFAAGDLAETSLRLLTEPGHHPSLAHLAVLLRRN